MHTQFFLKNEYNTELCAVMLLSHQKVHRAEVLILNPK